MKYISKTKQNNHHFRKTKVENLLQEDLFYKKNCRQFYNRNLSLYENLDGEKGMESTEIAKMNIKTFMSDFITLYNNNLLPKEKY